MDKLADNQMSAFWLVLYLIIIIFQCAKWTIFTAILNNRRRNFDNKQGCYTRLRVGGQDERDTERHRERGGIGVK